MSIEQPGQRIALGEINQLGRSLPFERDVFENPDVADRPAVDVLDRMALLGDQAAVGHLDFVILRRAAIAAQLEQMRHLFFRACQHRGGFFEYP